MSYTKTVVCLANSRRPGGFCFAGKEVDGEKYGDWVRPVSGRDDDAVSASEQKFASDELPQLLDVVAIPLLKQTPHAHQQENHLIDASEQWKKTGRLDKNELNKLVDDVSGDLWVNGRSSNKGGNNRISPSDIKKLNRSLYLIKPEYLEITVQWKDGKSGKRECRAGFGHNGNNYILSVTDHIIEGKYIDKSTQEYYNHNKELPICYPITGNDVYLCVSLAENPSYGFYYKLVAAIIGDDS